MLQCKSRQLFLFQNIETSKLLKNVFFFKIVFLRNPYVNVPVNVLKNGMVFKLFSVVLIPKPFLLKLNLNSDKESKCLQPILLNKISNQASIEIKHDGTERGGRSGGCVNRS